MHALSTVCSFARLFARSLASALMGLLRTRLEIVRLPLCSVTCCAQDEAISATAVDSTATRCAQDEDAATNDSLGRAARQVARVAQGLVAAAATSIAAAANAVVARSTHLVAAKAPEGIATTTDTAARSAD